MPEKTNRLCYGNHAKTSCKEIYGTFYFLCAVWSFWRKIVK
jgi:hypothetical protein